MKKIHALLACATLALLASPSMAVDITVDDFRRVSTKRISLNEFEYEFKASVQSNEPNLIPVPLYGIVGSNTPSTKVVQRIFYSGFVPPKGQIDKNESKSFTLRLDRSKPFNAKDLSWTFTDVNPYLSGELRTLTTLTRAQGAYVNELVQMADGDYYGTASDGGNYNFGTVFRVSSKDGLAQVLHSFDRFGGATPSGALVNRGDGYLYGVASTGGSYQGGTLFRISPAGVITTLYEFNGDRDGGTSPDSLVLGDDGNLYGTAAFGTSAFAQTSFGSIFQWNPQNGALKTMHTFSGKDGDRSGKLLAVGANTYYGVSTRGGAYDGGTAFKFSPISGLTVLHSFSAANGNKGFSPVGPLAESPFEADTAFLGTTQSGGTNSCGTVYKMSRKGEITWLHAFDQKTEGCAPKGLTTKNGTFYYVQTSFGGPSANNGVLFKMTRYGLPLAIYYFDSTEFKSSAVPLLIDRDGRLLGSTRVIESEVNRIFVVSSP
jgi:uncharacterized repeat protein (TIGR03803 family)